jgi:Txe/YoeB family toxin of Txe-Axe toxin-antitoxin module
MDKSTIINFNKKNVRELELFAESLELILTNKDKLSTNFSLILLNIESFIPNSNIFNYIFKTDIFKREKIKLSIEKGKVFEKIKIIDKDIENLVKRIDELVKEIDEKSLQITNKENKLNEEYQYIDNINLKLSEMDNKIDESEWKVYLGSSEEVFFNFIKRKLIIEKKLIK